MKKIAQRFPGGGSVLLSEAMASLYGNSALLPVVEEGEDTEPFGSGVSLLSLERAVL